MSRGSLITILVLCSSATMGCDTKDASHEATGTTHLDVALDSLARVVEIEVRQRDDERFACGATKERPAQILIATAQQCIGCRDVAWYVRQANRSQPGAGMVWVVTGEGDAREVCEYLARNRSQAPVYTVPPELLIHVPHTDDLVLLDFVDGGPSTIYHAWDALLLHKAAAGEDASAGTRAPL